MPLVQGNSREAISENIRRELAAGKKRAQSIAIALDVARRSAHHADGGMAPPPMSWDARQEAREAFAPVHPPGLIASTVPGRTDRHEIDVPAGSYIMPSAVVSGLGEDNTLAGAAILDRMFGVGPYGTRLPRGGGRGSNIPHPPPMFREGMFEERAQGGETGGKGNTVPIVVAGGEYLLHPEQILNHPTVGRGGLRSGHAILDAFVKSEMKKKAKTTAKLPGPKR